MKTGLSIITFLDSLFTSRDIICSPLNFWFLYCSTRSKWELRQHVAYWSSILCQQSWFEKPFLHPAENFSSVTPHCPSKRHMASSLLTFFLHVCLYSPLQRHSTSSQCNPFSSFH